MRTPTAEPNHTRRLGAAAAKAADRGAARAAGGTQRAIRGKIRNNPTAYRAYRTGVGVVGGATVALGVVMIPLPGPGILVVAGGLAILATEFEGAKQASRHANAAVRQAYEAVKAARQRRSPPIEEHVASR